MVGQSRIEDFNPKVFVVLCVVDVLCCVVVVLRFVFVVCFQSESIDPEEIGSISAQRGWSGVRRN